ncbi:TIGR03089 family protein [Saccharomonospora xinjiangensis]|uniref:TIGR03089 family protein n=1 Tax=Saccharomonospora xinjiangensis TaxID=75294 RepID=UPI00350FE030
MSLTEHLLRPMLSASAGKPAITHYDDAAGSRIELSVATLANWAAKTANWLVEEFDVEPGDKVAVNLPAHWQTAGVLLGAWWCGAHVVTTSHTGAASASEAATDIAVTFVGPEYAERSSVNGMAGATAVVALDPLGRGLATPPPGGAFDYLSEARTCGDEFSPLFPLDGDTPALLGTSVDELLSRARERATELRIGDGDRVLSTRAWTLPDGVVDSLLAPLAAGAHVVQVTNADPARRKAHRDAERITVDLP